MTLNTLSEQYWMAWCQQHNLSPQVSATFNILYNNPLTTAPDDYRLDICAAIEQDVAANPFGIVEKTIPPS
jgi:AraC family transcriptional regulator